MISPHQANFAPDFSTEEQPVFFHGALSESERKPFRLAREIESAARPISQWTKAELPSAYVRPMYRIEKSDPVTTRVLQLWRPNAHQSKARWINEFIKLRPPDALLCWLVLVRAVAVADVLNAMGEYGWSGAPRVGRVRLEDCDGDVVEFRRRLEWALAQVVSEYGVEWLDRDEAGVLLSACEAAVDAVKEDEARR